MTEAERRDDCLKDLCRSPLACGGFGYCREKNFDYEASCILATRIMRERLIRAGQILPRPDDPEEREWHEQWKSHQTKGV